MNEIVPNASSKLIDYMAMSSTKVVTFTFISSRVRWNSPQLFHPGHQLTEKEAIHGNCFSYARYSLFPIKGFIEMLLRSRLACFSASGQRLNQNF